MAPLSTAAAGRPAPVRAYLDAASGQPLHPPAAEALWAALGTAWSDPARLHHEGRRASLLLATARESVAGNLGVQAHEVIFAGIGAVGCSTRAVLAAERGSGAVSQRGNVTDG